MRIKEIERSGHLEIKIKNQNILVSVVGYKYFDFDIDIDKCAYTVDLSIDTDQPYFAEKKTIFDNFKSGKSFFVYNGVVYMLEGKVNEEEGKILVEHYAIKKEKKFEKLKKEIDLYKQASSIKTESREVIPEEVKFAVWRRDEGRCVKCGSQENLEFDHIIPVSKGGSNTARNIQILCERCNREKYNFI